MNRAVNLSRRRFLQVGAALGGGLLVGFRIPALAAAESEAESSDYVPNAWIRIQPDDQVTIMVASSEMGQGVMTSIPMLVAEELECDWERVRAETAPVDPVYNNPIIGQQLTGGSTAVRGFWEPVREAGAAARELLIATAADAWEVDSGACRAERGFVVHPPSGRRVRYGALVEQAASGTPPETVFLKEPDQFRILGSSKPRLDVPAKVDGSAVFGQDVQLPGLLTATVVRCPVFGGKPKSYDDSQARKVAGVRAIHPISAGLAVVADGFWPASKGAQALSIQWDEGEHGGLSTQQIRERFRQQLDAGKPARTEGDVAAALDGAARTVSAEYEVPYLAHACMEPMNCTAHVRENDCEVWVPTQAQTRTRDTAARITGLPAERIQVHTTFLGGGFGRRSEQDFVRDAVELSKRMKAPVKVLWSREQDMQHDYYRPATLNRLQGGVDASGRPVAWSHDIAGPSIRARASKSVRASGMDPTSTEGAANLPYAIPNLSVRYAMVNPGVPVGYWRSVGSSQNAYVTECFFDELAAAAGRDPYELRRELLEAHPRHRKVLEVAADKAGWGEPLSEGRARGIAVAESFTSFVAQVAEVSIQEGRVRVHRVVCAVDCGQVVNPDTIEAQMQSGIVYGLTAALHGEITIKDGRVEQSNFHDYPALRYDEMPEVEVHIVHSGQPPGGVGEPGTPPIAPAVANAVFALTGKPVRRLPIRLS